MDITEFVKARLDEDEAAAMAAASDAERFAGRANWTSGGKIVTDAEDADWAICDLSPFIDDECIARHIARHDPARVLREVAAKWVIVRDYERSVRACRDVTGPELDSRGYASMCGGRDALRAACLALAAAWSDHPDYRAECKP